MERIEKGLSETERAERPLFTGIVALELVELILRLNMLSLSSLGTGEVVMWPWLRCQPSIEDLMDEEYLGISELISQLILSALHISCCSDVTVHQTNLDLIEDLEVRVASESPSLMEMVKNIVAQRKTLSSWVAEFDMENPP